MTSLFKEAEEAHMFAKVAFWGRQGTGKTTHMVKAAVALHRARGSKGTIMMIDTENCSLTVREMMRAFDIPFQFLQTTKPAEAYKALGELNDSPDCSVLLIDSVTDLYKRPRQDWLMENKKDQIPLNKYSGIDKPFAAFCERLKWVNANVVYTMREKTETETVEENDQSHKVPDGKGAEYIARVKVHAHALKRKNDDMAVRMDISDDAAPGKIARVVNPTDEVWDQVMARFV